MEEARIPGYFKNKGILITGSTGFLGKSKHAACLSCLAERRDGEKIQQTFFVATCIVLTFT